MSKRQLHPKPGDKVLRFWWDEQGGAHVNRDPTHTMSDLRKALLSLAAIVAHNEYLNGGMPPVWRMLQHIEDAVFDYLHAMVLDEADGSDIQPIPEGRRPGGGG